MVRGVAALGFVALSLPFAALELFSFLNSQFGGADTTTCGEAPPRDSAAGALPPLAAAALLFVAVGLIYLHLMGRRVVDAAVAVAVAGAAGNGRRSISGLLMFVLCVCAGTLAFIVFGQAPSAGAGDGGRGALAMAALRALPAAATATFFLGMTLIIVAHVRAGGEGGGTGPTGAVAGDGPLQRILRVLTKIVAGMAAALVGLMAMAVTLYGAKY